MSAELNPTRVGRDIQKLLEEVINHLITADGCNVTLSLEVSAHSADGFSTSLVRTVTENCNTLKVQNYGFEP